jgi:hypothetical protein
LIITICSLYTLILQKVYRYMSAAVGWWSRLWSAIQQIIKKI